MASTLLKATIGITAGTATVGVGATVAYLTSDSTQSKEASLTEVKQEPKENQTVKKSILNLLKKKDKEKEMLSANDGVDTEGWSASWDKFKKKFTEAKDKNTSWKFKDWEQKLSGNEVTKEFKDQCDTNSKVDVENEQSELYLEVKEFCTKDKPRDAS